MIALVNYHAALRLASLSPQPAADMILTTLNIVAPEHAEDIAFLRDFYRIRAGKAPNVWNKITSTAA